MMNNDWKLHFLELAIMISTRSKDPSAKVGAIIVDAERRIVGSGYNGFPRHVSDDPERYTNRETKLRMVVHAEVNAILNSTKSVRGCTLISTRAPCCACSGVIIQSGVDVVICPDQAANSKWNDDWMVAKQMLLEAGVVIDHLHLPRNGMSLEEYNETCLRSILEDLTPPLHLEECNPSMNICDPSCLFKDHDSSMALDTISRLLRGKSL